MPCSCLRSLQRRAVAQHDGMVLLDGLLALLMLTAALATLATVAVHALRDSRATARTAQAMRLLHDGAERQRLEPAGPWPAQWQTEVAAALPDGEGMRTARGLVITWRDTSSTALRRLELALVP